MMSKQLRPIFIIVVLLIVGAGIALAAMGGNGAGLAAWFGSETTARTTPQTAPETTPAPESEAPGGLAVVDAAAIDAGGTEAGGNQPAAAVQTAADGASPADERAITTAHATTPQSLPDTISHILERGSVTIGIAPDSAPFRSTGPDGAPVGFEIDLARALGQRWLGDANAVQFVELQDDAAQQLATGTVDLVIAQWTPSFRQSDTGAAVVDASQPYFMSEQALLVPAAQPLNDWPALQGATIGTVSGATQLADLRARSQRDNLGLTFLPAPSYAAARELLVNGEVAAIAGNRAVLTALAESTPDMVLSELDAGSAAFSIGLAPAASHLREMINFTLQEMKQNGSYDAIHWRWFPNTEPLALETGEGFWPYSFASLPTQLAVAPAGAESSAGAPPPTQATYQKILARGKIVAGVATDAPPFGLTTADGEVAGFDPAMLREFARRWLGDPDAVEFVTGSTEEQIDRLVAGEVDVVATTLANEWDWADLVDFSRTYMGPPATAGYLRLALPQGDFPFRQLVDFTLEEMQADGTYGELFGYWLGAGTPVFSWAPATVEPGFVPLAYTAPVDPVALASATSTLARIRARNNRLVAGVKYDFSPFGFLDENGEVVGFDVDLIQALAELWGVQVELVQVTSANRIDKVAAGEVDLVAASMTHTQGREATIDFSQTYFADGQSLLVRGNAGINGIRELDGGRVAAIEGSTSIIQINDHAAANGVAVEIVPFQGYGPAVDALLAGTVDAVTTDSVALHQFAREHDELAVVGELFTHEPYGMGLPSGEPTLANLVNSGLQTLKRNGLYDQLYAKWFSAEATPYPIELLPGDLPYSFADAPNEPEIPTESVLTAILDEGKLVAGVTQTRPPLGFVDGTGTVTGFEIDLLREFAKRWLGDRDALQLVPLDDQTPAGELAARLADGTLHLLVAGLSHTPARAAVMGMSQSYLRSPGLGDEPFAVGLPRGDATIRDLVNLTLQEMKSDGSYDRLYAKWLGAETPFELEVWPGASYLPVSVTPMLRIPAGDFVRGSDSDLPDEQPAQTVSLPAFYLDQFEVTNRLYDFCVRAGECGLPQQARSLASGLYYADPIFHNFPVIWVTWQDAADYCDYVGKRLPTEAEWEKAARGPNAARYPWGDAVPAAQTNFNYLEGDLAEVGAYAADISPFGVSDMAGNVREWTADWYHWETYRTAADEGGATNMTGPTSGTTRVVRGGAWNDDALALRGSARRNLLPTSADANLGFRCASSTPPGR